MLENQTNANYTEYTIEVVHHQEQGICASPIAGAYPQRISLTRLHAPCEFVQVFWTATREGAAPILPSHRSFLNGNRVFIGGARTGLIVPTLGGHSYSTSGVYVYAISQAEGLDSAFALSMCPWETPSNAQGMSLVDFGIPSENFSSGILNPYLGNLYLPVDTDVLLLQSPLQG